MQFRHLLRAAALPAALGISLLGSTAAFAAEPAATAATPAARPATTVIVGTGKVAATGAGVARIRGTFVTTGRMAGGTIVVDGVDRFTAMHVTGWRSRTRVDRDTVIFRGVFGTFSIAGRAIRVTITSPLAHVVAVGHGAAYLKGTGTYRVDGGPVQPWTSAGAWLAL